MNRRLNGKSRYMGNSEKTPIPEQPERDLWGRIVKEYHAGGGASPVTLRRDDGFAMPLPHIPASYFSPPTTEEQEILERLQGRVLDVGCGPGHHVVWLQEQGIEVVGIDDSPGAVEVAQARGCRQAHVMDCTEIDFPSDHFDAALLMGNNLGIAGTPERTEQMYRALNRMVRPGGLLIGDGASPLAAENPMHLAYFESNRAAGRADGQLRVRLECEDAIGEWFRILLLEHERLTALLNATAWDVLEWPSHAEQGRYYMVACCSKGRPDRPGR